MFLGSGASYGALHPYNTPHLQEKLSNLIVDRFLSDEFNDQPQQYTSKIAISEYDLLSVQKYIALMIFPSYY
ncbi:hypothetical protein ACFLSA_06970, partial [Bacteroidota bacterium]